MKIAILGDTHFGVSQHSVPHHDYFKKFFKFFFYYLVEHDIQDLIQLGDLFDNRKTVHYSTIKWTKENFFDELITRSICTYIIAGNHDILYKNTSEVNSVSLLCPDNIVVIDKKPRTTCGIDMYPWINDSNITQSHEFIKNTTSKIAVGHFEFSGFPLHPGTIAESGADHSLFTNYECVLSGHYHTVSTKDNITYTGTPYELTWSDCDDPKGFWILDTDTSELTYIRNPHTLFMKIYYSDGLKIDFSECKDKFIKIYQTDIPDRKKFDKFMESVNQAQPHSVSVIETVIKDSVGKSVTNLSVVSTDKMIVDVITDMDITLDKVKLKTSVMEIYSEAMSLNNSL